jgi:beta-lactam-binding protein with PASTA domain
MGSSKNILHNWIVKNILMAIAAFAVLVLIFYLALALITNHNRVVSVPDFTDMTVSEAKTEASGAGVKVDIFDSVFVKRMSRGAVFSQNPRAGMEVKKGRHIQLTINSVLSKKIRMPNLVGYSMRQAKAELYSKGLNLGRLIYVSDMATNNVIKQLYRNSDIKAGSLIVSGSDIDLQVGLDSSDNKTYIPDVLGLKYRRAVDAVHDNSLNVSRITFDKSVRNYADSIRACVYRQSPESSQAPVLMGTPVTLFMTVDQRRLPSDK